MLLTTWKADSTLDQSVAMVAGLLSFGASALLAKKLAKELPDSTGSTAAISVSAVLAAYLTSRYVFGNKSAIPTAVSTGASSASMQAYLAKML